MGHITLNVCQGVGDIFWVYQKFAPYFDRIDFNILLTEFSPRQQRANQIIKILPNVVNVNFKQVPYTEYDSVANGVFHMPEIMQKHHAGEREFNYSCNKLLEEGHRIELIDPAYPIEETVPLPTKEIPMSVYSQVGYICLYVSGDTRDESARKNLGVWEAATWIRLIETIFMKQQVILPVVVVGASIDADIVQNLESLIKSRNIMVTTYIDLEPANLFYVLKNCKLFVAYQSGLSIIADNLDVPQIMLYYPKLHKMLYAWAKKNNIKNKTYQAAIFSQPIVEIVNNLRLPVWMNNTRPRKLTESDLARTIQEAPFKKRKNPPTVLGVALNRYTNSSYKFKKN